MLQVLLNAQLPIFLGHTGASFIKSTVAYFLEINIANFIEVHSCLLFENNNKVCNYIVIKQSCLFFGKQRCKLY